MKTLWFKSCYVADILAGKKKDTIRKGSCRLPSRGEIVAFSVGPRAPFAKAAITGVEQIEDLPDWRRDQVVGAYGEIPADAVRLIFELTEKFETRR